MSTHIRRSLPHTHVLVISAVLLTGCPPSDLPITDTAIPVCGSGTGSLPDGLTELSFDDEMGMQTIYDVDYVLEGYSGSYETVAEVQWEAVRFELEHPAQVHGFSVQWTQLPKKADDPELEIAAGLYPDFGYNGFDFDRWNPLWEGSRCREDLKDGQWVDYVFDEPIAIEHPGLVYVAHKKKVEGDPVWWMDAGVDGTGDCAAFDECRSAWNFPKLETDQHYNGWSFALPWDYLVRLHVSYEVDDAPPVFEPVPELSLSNRSSWGDYDNDGWDDLMTNGLRLLRNLGDGSFEDVTATSGIGSLGIGAGGGVWGDYDNDGCLDFFGIGESYTGDELLLHNECDGTFTNATETSTIHDVQEDVNCTSNEVEHSPTNAAAWVDLDGDGLLDLYLANMICWDLWTFYRDRFWHNEGEGIFSEWSTEHGFSSEQLSARGVAPADADGDGDVDLFVNNYTLHRNLFYDNQGDGTVVESGAVAGLQGVPVSESFQTYYGHTIGAAWGDIDGDGHLDMVHANLAHPRFYHFSDRTAVLRNNGDGSFTDLSETAGLRYQETHSVPLLADIDLDGHLDLAITAVYDGRPTDFYWGEGDGSFTLDSYRTGITTESGWGIAASDYDGDGDVDIATYELWENTGTWDGHWLQVRAVGNVSANRAALGATVYVRAGDREWVRHVQGGTGQGGQDSLFLHFGLADAQTIDEIEVQFPGGGTVAYPGPISVDNRVWVYEDGTHFVSFEPPAHDLP